MALPICCMVRPTQVFMDFRLGETAIPTIAPSTMPAPIPRQKTVFSISSHSFSHKSSIPQSGRKSRAGPRQNFPVRTNESDEKSEVEA